MDEENQLKDTPSPDAEQLSSSETSTLSPSLSLRSPDPANTTRTQGGNSGHDLAAIVELGSQTSLTEVKLALSEEPVKEGDSTNRQEMEATKDGGRKDGDNDLEPSFTEEDLSLIPSHSAHNNNMPRQISSRQHRMRQASNTNMYGGFGEMNQAVKLYQKIGAAVKDGKYETLDKLYMGSSEVAHLEESRIKFQAREKSIRRTTGFTLFLFSCYFIISVPILVHVGGVGFQNSLLYCVYTMTSTGFGSIKVPLTSSGFLVFLIFVMFFGVACVTLVASTLYLYISFQASKIKKKLDKASGAKQNRGTSGIRRPGKFMTALRSCAFFVGDNVRKSECARITVIGGYLAFIWWGGAVAMYCFEDWTFPQALYFTAYCMTTMGYGDVAPVTSGGIWFVIFWLPLNVTFISLYMGNLARYYMLFGNAYTRRVYKREIANLKKFHRSLDELRDLVGVDIGDSTHSKTAEDTSVHSMQVVVDLVLENFLHNENRTRSATLRKLLDLQSPWTASGPFHANKVRKPSLALQLLMQERLITIMSEDVAGMFTSFFEKDSTFVIAIEALHAVAEKWKIPAGAREAFAQVAFGATVYVGEKRLIVHGNKALLKLTPFECHALFSPVLAAFEDAGTMEGWLATTEEIASSYSNLIGFSWTKIEGKLALCDNERDIVTLAGLIKKYDRSMEETQAMNLSRYQANRTLAGVMLACFLVYQTLATVYIIKVANLTVYQGLIYTVYTMTSAGFGSVKVPTTDSFLLVAIVNMFISISLFAVIIAQTLLYFQAVIVRREHASDKMKLAYGGQAVLASLLADTNQEQKQARDIMRMELSKALRVIPGSMKQFNHATKKERMISFLIDTERGRVICVACILLSLWFMGAFAMMITEGWSIFQGLYFATFALLTVGHGDLVPTTEAGSWFLVVWLPFNILFVSLYLGSVAHLFVVLSNKYNSRIEQQIRRERMLAKQETNKKEAVQLCGDTIDIDPQEEPDISRADKIQRRIHIKQTSQTHIFLANGSEITYARDLLNDVPNWQPPPDPSDPTNVITEGSFRFTADGPSGLGSRYNALLKNAINDEGFALRLKVLDRVARIISEQLINDFDFCLEVDGSNLRASVDSLKDWITDWNIPQRARQTYRVITFESLLFVGEKELFDKGIGAFVSLSIIEFIELFSPFVFALKHKEAMEEWLASTDDLADKRLPQGLDDQCQLDAEATQPPGGRFSIKNSVQSYFPDNPGNAIRVQLKNY